MDTNKERDRKSFKENTANLNTKQKVLYIWEYYKYHIIATILTLLFITSFIIGRINAKEVILNVNILTRNINNGALSQLVNASNDALVNEGEKKEAQINYFYFSETEGLSTTFTQKLIAQMSASELDVLILSKSEFERWAQQGAFTDLNVLLKSEDSKYSSLKYIYSKAAEKDTAEKAYGIALKSLPKIQSLDLMEPDAVFAVLENSEYKDNVIKFLDLLLK